MESTVQCKIFLRFSNIIPEFPCRFYMIRKWLITLIDKDNQLTVQYIISVFHDTNFIIITFKFQNKIL